MNPEPTDVDRATADDMVEEFGRGAVDWTEHRTRIAQVIAEARAKGYAQGAFDARREFANTIRGRINQYMEKHQ